MTDLLFRADEMIGRMTFAAEDRRSRSSGNGGRYIEEEVAALLTELRAEVERWQKLRSMVSGERSVDGKQYFGFPTRFALPPVGNIMKGSVAQHLDDAIDALLPARKEGGES